MNVGWREACAHRAQYACMARTANGGWEGRIYNPEDGQTYRATLRRPGADTLTIEGCVLFICQKQVWRSAASLSAALH